MKILEELWYGNINPNERDVKLGSRLHKLGALIVRHEETLMPLLSEQAKEIYEKLRDCHSELQGINECEASGLPVWYDIIPGNVLDINTVMNVLNDVGDSLNIVINSLVLDAGYTSRELLGAFHIGTDKTIIGRIRAKFEAHH